MNHTCVLNKVVSFDGKTELDFWKSKEMQFEAIFSTAGALVVITV